MSNVIGHSLLHQGLLRPATSREHQTKNNSSSSLLLPSVSSSQLAVPASKSSLSSEFCGSRAILRKPKLSMGTRHGSLVPKAVLAADPASELVRKFKLDGNSELRVDANDSQINILVTNSSNSLILHWGAISDRKDGYFLLIAQMELKYIRTELSKLLLLKFKHDGANFNIKLPIKGKPVPISLPEDLEEYEAARTELLEEITRGTSIEELRLKLKKGNDQSEMIESRPHEVRPVTSIPDDLVQIQAYIRWEKAGKPNYSQDQQIKEFVEARKELQKELEKGISLEEIRKKIIKGEIETKVAKQLEKKKYFAVERIERKKRDLMQLINKYTVESEDKKIPTEPKALDEVELFMKAKKDQDGGAILNKTFDIGDRKLLVLVTKPAGKTRVYLATDFKEPLTLHWALSKRTGEWLAPPSSAIPPGSVSLDKASETPFERSSFIEPVLQGQSQEIQIQEDLQLQTLEIDIPEDNFVGMPFVLLSGGQWIKNKGSDFYIDFAAGAKQALKEAGDGKGTAKDLLEKIAGLESEAQKSFMHRFNIAADLLDQAKDAGEIGLAGILVWMRFMATRQLIWNKNYNVKPREISKAQDRLTDSLQETYKNHPQYHEILRMILSTVGRGGEGDVGQRIRDEILVIQRNNDCKGGMMEEWHQKLHNNTSPDDVVICQALIDYIKSDFDVSVYWKTLNENGITKERLLSYDRAIHSEPNFRRDQKEGLLRDLGNYMRTLKAVHSGADLESAISNCMGYKAEGQGFMVGVQINPVPGLPSGFPELLQFVLEHIEVKNVEPLLEGLLEARQELRPLLFTANNRLKDLLFLDIALDSAVRTAVERGYEELNDAGPEKIMYFISLVLENLALTSDNNEELIYCLKGWNHALSMSKSRDNHWALYAKSAFDRTRLALASKAEWYQQVLQPSAEYLGSLLGVDKWAVKIFTEEIIRAGSAASLSALLNRLDPILRKTAHLGSWQIISPVEAVGYVVVVDELLTVQNKTYAEPTILVAKSVKGEEEIPDGTVAVLTPDMPDVLSHVSVRARNSKVCFATCFDSNILHDLCAKEGKVVQLVPTSADIIYSEAKEDFAMGASPAKVKEDAPHSSLSLVKKKFTGTYAISAEEFTSELVGAKSRNIAFLKGKVPSWVGIPTSVALPFGVFEKVLSDQANRQVAEKLRTLKEKLGTGDFSALGKIRSTVLELTAPQQLVQELKTKMQSSGMPWPGDEGEHRWEQAWLAIKKVWASKWNERAYFSTRKVKLDHEYLCMAVLVQEIINADYAFVIHTTNPSSGDSSEIYAEVVKGLGETLVGAYPGRALSFICKKNDLNSPKVLGYPSKPFGLFIRRSIIFRSDSNGEDLEGYAGAGLYDSVPMDEAEKVVIDYSSDPLINDENFRKSILSSIARAGHAIEELYGSPQDIEGVVRDGKIFVVQTRPQV
ncbi:Pyruvate phosphate dikinase, AMP/ATP-binding [Dillenia turbinata]|uniref:Pyruvate phosphate dikinase, AMP/ATP-binding n=1 Tax=Dillenia turbinata TaxID=194707 RepID=A0AAN8Z4E4_9MAGN